MNKRIRKKRLLGEFTRLGFNVSGQATAADKEAFVQDLVSFAEDSTGLDVALSVDVGTGFFDMAAVGRAGSATKQDAAAIQKFLADKGVKNVQTKLPKQGLPDAAG